jgi:cardiolipin synthase
MRQTKVFLLAAATVVACGALAAPAVSGGSVKISGVLFDGLQKGDPEPDSAVRLTNTDPRRPARIGGYRVTEEFTPTKIEADARSMGGVDTVDRNPDANRKVAPGDRGGPRYRSVTLPNGAEIPPGGEIWVAHEAQGFSTTFGFLPSYEAVDTHPEVPELAASDGFLRMPAKHGTVALIDAHGEIADFVAYDVNKEPRIHADALPSGHWSGPPVLLSGSSPFAGRGLVLSRDRKSDGTLASDSNSARDWDSGFTAARLGVDEVHRIELPGQTLFPAKPLKGVSARVLATSAPDNNHRALLEALSNAKKTIRVSVYQLTNGTVADALIAAKKRGVDVTLWLEGSPVGGIPDEERYHTDRMSKAGIPVYFLASNSKKKIRARYRFDHSKYIIIDDTRVIIGTENYGRTGVPRDPSYGNRGWMIHVENPEIVRQLRAVWEADMRPGLQDVVDIRADTKDGYGLPFKDSGFRVDDTIQRGLYDNPAEPVYVAEPMDLELVLSPDTSLDENNALIGMIGRAKKSLYLQQNSVRRRWGGRSSTVEATPNLVLDAVVAAARRGVSVRVLLDGTWYNVTGDDERDNDDTVAMLTRLAREEGLDVAAKIINLETTHVEKIHAKGLIVDDREVFVGSINWTENSFKGNREVGIIVGHERIAGYYADLFRRDWSESRLYATTTREEIEYRLDPKGLKRAGSSIPKGASLFVVGEHGGDTRGPAFLEVRLGRNQTLYVPAGLTDTPRAAPNEAVHLLGRWGSVEGRVVATKVTDKVIQLRFVDDTRPPFIAVIFRGSEQKFLDAGLPPAQAFQGRRIRVSGRIQSYIAPEIVLSKPEQVEILP